MSITINGINTKTITLKQKEAKQLTFTYSVSINTATFALIVKDLSGVEAISKVDGDFNKTEVANREVSVTLDVNDLDLDAETYKMELKTIWNATTSVDKTVSIKLIIEESLFD